MERLSSLTHLGRSSRYHAGRHAVMREASYGAAAEKARGLPDSPELRARLARLQRLRGKRGQALRALDAVLERSPNLAEAHAWRWEAAGPGRAALAGLDRALSLEPRGAWWLVWRGLARLRPEGRTTADEARRALEDFDAAAALDASCALAHAGRALALAALKRLEAAVAALEAAARLEPEQGWLFQLRARARLALGDREGFVADSERSILRDEALGDLAKAFGSSAAYDPRSLVDACDRALKSAPDAWWLLALRGDLRRSPEVRDFPGGHADLEAAAALRPRCAWVWAYLARARQAAGDAEGAVAAATRGVSLAPGCGWIRVWRGEILRLGGRLRPALADFDRGLALNPDYELGYAWRGAARLESGQPDRALADLDLAVRLAPSYPFAAEQRARALAALGGRA